MFDLLILAGVSESQRKLPTLPAIITPARAALTHSFGWIAVKPENTQQCLGSFILFIVLHILLPPVTKNCPEKSLFKQ